MSLESDIRVWLRGKFPDANVKVASEEEDASPPARLAGGVPDEIVASIETTPWTGYGGTALWHESTVVFDCRSLDSRRAKRMGAAIQALSGTRDIGGGTISIESAGSFWDVEQAATEQFRTVETMSVRSA